MLPFHASIVNAMCRQKKSEQVSGMIVTADSTCAHFNNVGMLNMVHPADQRLSALTEPFLRSISVPNFTHHDNFGYGLTESALDSWSRSHGPDRTPSRFMTLNYLPKLCNDSKPSAITSQFTINCGKFSIRIKLSTRPLAIHLNRKA